MMTEEMQPTRMYIHSGEFVLSTRIVLTFGRSMSSSGATDS